MKLEFSAQIFEKSSNIKFHENVSSGSGRTYRRTDMTKLIVDFRNFANAPKTWRNFQVFRKTPVPKIATLDMRDAWMNTQFRFVHFVLARALRLWFLVDIAIGTKFEFPTARVDEDSIIPGGYGVSIGKWLPKFWRNISPSNSRSSSHAWFILLGMFTLKKGTTIFRNADKYLPVCREWHIGVQLGFHIL